MQQEFKVKFQYPVQFTERVFKEENLVLRKIIEDGEGVPAKVLVIADQNLINAHPDLITTASNYFKLHKDVFAENPEFVAVPGGEACKNDFSNVLKIAEAINNNNICRHSYVVAIGGGAVLDLAGFAAAISHRGVRLIRVPTTVLSQNDSGVGVKNGVNFLGKKNFLGTFCPPYAVINDFSFLSTLSDRDYRSGISEAVKVALIKDKSFFKELQINSQKYFQRDESAMRSLIKRCAELHLNHIGGADPFESGSSRPLDFGHWSAHKLEQISNYTLNHGEAVAIGIALDSVYSFKTGYLSKAQLVQILKVFIAVGFDIYSNYLEDQDLILQGLQEFREHLGGQLTIMLLEEIGTGKEVHEINESLMLESVSLLKILKSEIESEGQLTI